MLAFHSAAPNRLVTCCRLGQLQPLFAGLQSSLIDFVQPLPVVLDPLAVLLDRPRGLRQGFQLGLEQPGEPIELGLYIRPEDRPPPGLLGRLPWPGRGGIHRRAGPGLPLLCIFRARAIVRTPYKGVVELTVLKSHSEQKIKKNYYLSTVSTCTSVRFQNVRSCIFDTIQLIFCKPFLPTMRVV